MLPPMGDLFKFPNAPEARRRLLARTALITTAILAVVMPADFVINVWILKAIANYTPLSTLFITLLISPPSVLFLLLQTERVRQAQGALAAEQGARIALEAVNVARNRFLANTSHELRTPLSGIIGYTELLMEAAREEGRARDLADLERVAASGQRMLDLVNDLLDLAKLEAGRFELKCARFDLAEMLADAAAAAASAAAKNRNNLCLELEHPLGQAHTDQDRLQHCVLNLLLHRARSTSDGVITMRAEVREQTLIVSVEDAGPGVAPDQRPLMFEPFLQAQAEDAGREGSGLELAISRRLAELLGGEISYEALAGRGSKLVLKAALNLAMEAPGHPQRLAPAA